MHRRGDALVGAGAETIQRSEVVVSLLVCEGVVGDNHGEEPQFVIAFCLTQSACETVALPCIRHAEGTRRGPSQR